MTGVQMSQKSLAPKPRPPAEAVVRDIPRAIAGRSCPMHGRRLVA